MVICWQPASLVKHSDLVNYITIVVYSTYQPAVAVLVVGVVSVIPVVVAAKVVAHLVYGGVVGVGAALLHRGQSVAATGAGRVGVAAPAVVEVIGQKLGRVRGSSRVWHGEFKENQMWR